MNFADLLSSLSTGSYISFGVFVICAIIQLVFAFLEKEKYRRIEKPFCLLSLAVFALVCLPNKPLIYVGAIFGMIGDILVIIKDKKYFSWGVLSFFFGHICYIVQLILFMANKNTDLYFYFIPVICFVIFYIALFFPFKKFAKHIPEQLGMALYYATLFTLLPFTIVSFINIGSYMFLGIIGAFFFVISDLIILYTKYIKKFKRYDFYIMLTYLIAQALIIVSFVFTIMDLGL